MQSLAWSGLGNGPQLWHLRQNLDAFHTWNSTPILSLGTFLALSGHCNWSSTCPLGPSQSISWRMRHTSHHHLLSGRETHSLNSRFVRLFSPLWLQGLSPREHFRSCMSCGMCPVSSLCGQTTCALSSREHIHALSWAGVLMQTPHQG